MSSENVEQTSVKNLGLGRELSEDSLLRIGKLQRDSNTSALLTFFSVVLFLVALVWSYVHLRSTSSQLASIERKIVVEQRIISSLDERKSDLNRQILDLNKRAAAYNVILNSAASDPKGGQAIVNRALASNPDAAASIQRVYIQITREDQRPVAENAATVLKNAGFAVPFIQLIALKGSLHTTQLRYFDSVDAEAKTAEQLQQLLASSGISAQIVHLDLPAGQQRPKRNSYELWFGLDRSKNQH